jgi:hypothetical protein
VRIWWVDGASRLVTAHPDTPGQLPPPELDLAGITAPVGALGLPFIAVDLVRRSDGAWRVVEVGDGQVSDRPITTNADNFMTGILATPPELAGPASPRM